MKNTETFIFEDDILKNHISLICSVIIVICGIILNTGVILFILIRIKDLLFPNLLLINIFLCDLILCCSIQLSFLENGLSENICKVLNYITFLTIHSILLTFIINVIQSYIFIFRSIWFWNINPSFLLISILLIWLCAFLISSPILIFMDQKFYCGFTSSLSNTDKVCATNERILFNVISTYFSDL